MHANLRLSQQALVQDQLAVSRERNRLARELHDTLAHTLSGLTVQLEAIHTILETEQKEVNDMLEKALFTARNGLEETRRALKALRAEPLEDLGLQLALKNLVSNTQSRTRLNIHLSLSDNLIPFTQEEEQMIYRITQEALENIIHHANARNVWLGIDQKSGKSILSIRDDGAGFDQSMLTKKNDRLGLKGMRERAEMLNACLEIESQPDQGTLIQLKLRN